MQDLQKVAPGLPVFFIKVPPPLKFELQHTLLNSTQSSPIRTIQNTLERHNLSNDIDVFSSHSNIDNKVQTSMTLFQQLLHLGYLSMLPSTSLPQQGESFYKVESELIEKFSNFASIVVFARQVLRNHLVRATNLLNVVHTRCLQKFIMTAFDMQRDMIITPRKLEFARTKETELFALLMEMALKKQDEIRRIIAETIADMRDDLLQRAADFEFKGE